MCVSEFLIQIVPSRSLDQLSLWLLAVRVSFCCRRFKARHEHLLCCLCRTESCCQTDVDLCIVKGLQRTRHLNPILCSNSHRRCTRPSFVHGQHLPLDVFLHCFFCLLLCWYASLHTHTHTQISRHIYI